MVIKKAGVPVKRYVRLSYFPTKLSILNCQLSIVCYFSAENRKT
ncbi:hypothetical protein PARMER_03520 [Parabacteroides merdae ATCC 43184]|nr:hypothetical protein PARMER_03520 [Parabacteroides merdae ATCC 43184]